MPNRLAEACLPFADEALKIRTAEAVLVALGRISRIVNVDVLGTWYLPSYFAFRTDFKVGENVFLHPDAPAGYYANYLHHLKTEGRSTLASRARLASAQFTIAAAERDDKRRKNAGWIYSFLRSYGIRDGLYCPFRTWALIYSSNRLLALKPAQRALLTCVAHTAVNRIENIVTERHSKRHTKPAELTAREIEVLQQRATVGSTAAIAKALNIDVKTVDSHLASARRKLKVDDTAIALLEAFSRGLIHYPP
jgi:DNA-binding CsgD family transcriptional regulator